MRCPAWLEGCTLQEAVLAVFFTPLVPHLLAAQRQAAAASLPPSRRHSRRTDGCGSSSGVSAGGGGGEGGGVRGIPWFFHAEVKKRRYGWGGGGANAETSAASYGGEPPPPLGHPPYPPHSTITIPACLAEVVALLESHPFLRVEHGPVLIGARQTTAGGDDSVEGDLGRTDFSLSEGDGLFILVGDIAGTPSVEDIQRSGIVDLVVGWLRGPVTATTSLVAPLPGLWVPPRPTPFPPGAPPSASSITHTHATRMLPVSLYESIGRPAPSHYLQGQQQQGRSGSGSERGGQPASHRGASASGGGGRVALSGGTYLPPLALAAQRCSGEQATPAQPQHKPPATSSTTAAATSTTPTSTSTTTTTTTTTTAAIVSRGRAAMDGEPVGVQSGTPTPIGEGTGPITTDASTAASTDRPLPRGSSLRSSRRSSLTGSGGDGGGDGGGGRNVEGDGYGGEDGCGSLSRRFERGSLFLGGPSRGDRGGPLPQVGGGGGEGGGKGAASTSPLLSPPPRSLAGHVLVITDVQLERLPLFLAPLHRVSDRSVVILSTAGCGGAPPALLRYAERLRRRGAGPRCPQLYYVCGDALSVTDLRRAGVTSAARIVIVSRSGSLDLVSSSSARKDAGLATPGINIAAGGYYYARGSFSSSITTISGHDSVAQRAQMHAHRGLAQGESVAADARGILATVLLESLLAGANPALVASTTTEVLSQASFLLLGPSPAVKLRSGGLQQQGGVRGRQGHRQHQQSLGEKVGRKEGGGGVLPAAASTHYSAVVRHRTVSIPFEWHPAPQPREEAPAWESGNGGEKGGGGGDVGLRHSVTSQHVDGGHLAAAAVDAPAAEETGDRARPVDSAEDREGEVHGGGGGGGSSGGSGGGSSPSPASTLSSGDSPVPSRRRLPIGHDVMDTLRGREMAFRRSMLSIGAGEGGGREQQRQYSSVATHSIGADPTAATAEHALDDTHWRELLGYKWSSRYAAGRLFPLAFVNKLCISGFFNPGIFILAHMMAKGDTLRVAARSLERPSSSSPSAQRPAGPHAAAVIATSTTAAAPQPSGPTVGGGWGQQQHPPPPPPPPGPRSWAALFVHSVMHDRVVPLGLFRDGRAMGAPLPYVHTNPRLGAREREGDMLFVCVRVPPPQGSNGRAV